MCQVTPPQGGFIYSDGNPTHLFVVSSHAPARGASCRKSRYGVVSIWVSSHAPARGASLRVVCYFRCCMFQVTPPQGGLRRSFSALPAIFGFKSRPRKGGFRILVDALALLLSFKSRPRKGGFHDGVILILGCGVSSHAPARGASKNSLIQFGTALFQVTPPQGGLHGPPRRKRWRNEVSSHAPARGASESGVDKAQRRPVSSHAPARGAS